MSSPFIPCPISYSDIPGGGDFAIIVVSPSAPTLTQNQNSPGTFWLQPEPQSSGNLYYLAGFVGGVPQWELLSTSTGSIVAVAGTANQITVVTSAGTATISLPSAITTPGSLSTTTTLTAGTGITATTGNIVAITGNISTTAGSITSATTLTATLGDITATNGDLVLGTAGNKLLIAAGSNASVGLTGAMSGTPGSVIVATTACTASSVILYSRATAGGTLGNISITAQDGTGFTLTSDANETSTFNYQIIN